MTGLIATATAGFQEKPVILAIFAGTYLGIAMGRVPGLKLNRVGIALLGAIAMMIFGNVTTADVISYVNWPTIFLLFGFFVISAQLRLSGFYDWVAGGISARLGNPARFLFILMVVTGGLSAFLNHDIVCYVFTPIAGAALLRRQINPVPFLIALAISSNIGAAATLIGNPQNMMIGQVAHLDFGRYILWTFVPVIFAMAAAYGIIWMLSRGKLQLALPASTEFRPGNLSVQPGAHDQRAGHSRGGHRPVFLAAAQGNHRAGRRRHSSGQHEIPHRRFAEARGLADTRFLHGAVRGDRRVSIHRLRRSGHAAGWRKADSISTRPSIWRWPRRRSRI